MKKLSIVLLFLFTFTLLICAEENINNTQTYEDQVLEKKINDIIEKRLAEKLITKESNTKESNTKELNTKELNTKEENIKEEKTKEDTGKKNEIELFGKKIFNSENSIGTPSEIVAGKDYILSSGDVIRIVLWSENIPLGKDGIIELKIAANGVVAIPDLGVFTLRGKSIDEAENDIKERGTRRLRDFKASISLIQMRSINVFILGR